jgi:hypothetical protein
MEGRTNEFRARLVVVSVWINTAHASLESGRLGCSSCKSQGRVSKAGRFAGLARRGDGVDADD